jgi:hypothetical protein
MKGESSNTRKGVITRRPDEEDVVGLIYSCDDIFTNAVVPYRPKVLFGLDVLDAVLPIAWHRIECPLGQEASTET